MERAQNKNTDLKKRILLALAALFFLAAFVLPWFWPDASANYSGVKRDAAIRGAKFASEMATGFNYAGHFGTIRITAESVAESGPNPGDLRCNSDFKSAADPSATNYYTVTVGYRTVFGILLNTERFHVCRYH